MLKHLSSGPLMRKFGSHSLPSSGGPEMIFEVDTTQAGSASDTFILPLANLGTYNFDVAWGDGNTDTITVYNQADLSHTYTTGGTYTVTLTNNQADFGGILFNNGGDKAKITDISQWGTGFAWTRHLRAFDNCSNLDVSATDLIDCSNSTDLEEMFEDCTSLTSLAGFSNIGSVLMRQTFEGCSALVSVGTMDTTNVTNMQSIFLNCGALTTLPTLDATNCTNLVAALQNCSSLTAYPFTNTGSVTSFNSVAAGCSSMGSVGAMDLSSTTVTFNVLDTMFQNCNSANFTSVGPITFGTSASIRMQETFEGCSNLTSVTFSDDAPASIVSVQEIYRDTALTAVDNFDFSDVENWTGAFYNVTSLNSFNFGTLTYTSMNNGTNTWFGLTLTSYGSLLSSLATDLVSTGFAIHCGSSTYDDGEVDSGTTDGTTANKLIQSGQNFTSTVSVNDIVFNTTDTTFAKVTAVDSDTQLSLDADIMVSGEAYSIQGSQAAKDRYTLISGTGLGGKNITLTDGGVAP